MRGINPKADAMEDATAAAEAVFFNFIPGNKTEPELTSGQEADDCPKCGLDGAGMGNCCSPGGSWEGTCTNSPDEPGSEHTLREGALACSHVLAKPVAQVQEAVPSVYREFDGSLVVVQPQSASTSKAASSSSSEVAAPRRDRLPAWINDAVPTSTAEEHEAAPLETQAAGAPLGVQQRKCDSEREEWCDGFLSSGEKQAAMFQGQAIKPGADPRGCGAKVDVLGRRSVTDEWCVSSCGMMVPNCSPRLCVCDANWKPPVDEPIDPIDANKSPSALARAFDKNMDKNVQIKNVRKEKQSQQEEKVKTEREAPPETDEQLTARLKRVLAAAQKERPNSTEVSAVAVISGQYYSEEAPADGDKQQGDAQQQQQQQQDSPPTEEELRRQQLAAAAEVLRTKGAEGWAAKAVARLRLQNNASVTPTPPKPKGEEGWAAAAAARLRLQRQAKAQEAQENATDANANCAAWAASGECEKNPAYMATSCALSCQLLKVRGNNGWFLSGGTATALAQPEAAVSADVPMDESPDCGAWAAAGECTKNPSFMATSCSVSCQGLLQEAGEPPKDLGALDDDGEDDEEEKPKKVGVVKKEYADSSGFPEGGDASTCVKVTQVSDDWCRNNCASKPPVCPATLCKCSKKDEKKAAKKDAEACGPLIGIRCGQTFFDWGYETIHDSAEIPKGKMQGVLADSLLPSALPKRTAGGSDDKLVIPYLI